jgi:predicted GNAT family acetyltransferase
MAKVFAHEPDASRYTLTINGQLAAVADYRINRGSISFTHTFTQVHLRGRGHAAELVEFAIDDVERNTDLRVVPMCWYVQEWFDEHAERRALLAR